MWATWCSPCQYQMLELKKVYDNYPQDQIEILSINVDPGESNQDITDFINLFADYGYNLEWTFGNEVDDTSIYKIKPDSGIPSICFFDQNGNIFYKHVGVMLYDTIPDGFEVTNGLNPLENDTLADLDSEGLTNILEFTIGTNPNNSDTDSDGMPDQWELNYSLNPLIDDANLDPDEDSISNLQEFLLDLDPQTPDSRFDSALLVGIPAIIITVLVVLVILRRRRVN